jgi:hypothetical protein
MAKEVELVGLLKKKYTTKSYPKKSTMAQLLTLIQKFGS